MPKRTSIFQDEINAIRYLYSEGKTSEEISDELNIEVDVVVTFDPDYVPPVPVVVEDDIIIEASDAAVKLAEENNIDLIFVTGTGKDGNITKSDVEAVIAARKSTSE